MRTKNKGFRVFLEYAKIASCKKKKDTTPEIVDHCAARIVKEKGIPKSRAYAICVGRFQDYGILKKGKMDLTQKGMRYSRKHYEHRRAIDLKKVK